MPNTVKAKSEEDLEEAFRLITKGNKESEEKDYWKATESYAQAQSILQCLADAPPGKAGSLSEQTKIVTLYRHQSAEYLQRARLSLITALNYETESDRLLFSSKHQGTEQSSAMTPGNTDQSKVPLLSTLSEENCFIRTNLFGQLFAKELDDTKTMLDKESALTARLRHLSDSLPSTFKSEAERVRDLNRGLTRLGLSQLPNATGTGAEHRRSALNIEDSLPSSESEQVELILAQARDEVAVNAKMENPGLSGSALVDAAAKGTILITQGRQPNEVDSDDEDDSVPLSMADDDANLTPEIIKDMHIKLVAAQVAISELAALFDVDQSNDAAIEFEQPRGRALLKQARAQLRHVTEKWEAC